MKNTSRFQKVWPSLHALFLSSLPENNSGFVWFLTLLTCMLLCLFVVFLFFLIALRCTLRCIKGEAMANSLFSQFSFGSPVTSWLTKHLSAESFTVCRHFVCVSKSTKFKGNVLPPLTVHLTLEERLYIRLFHERQSWWLCWLRLLPSLAELNPFLRIRLMELCTVECFHFECLVIG